MNEVENCSTVCDVFVFMYVSIVLPWPNLLYILSAPLVIASSRYKTLFVVTSSRKQYSPIKTSFFSVFIALR